MCARCAKIHSELKVDELLRIRTVYPHENVNWTPEEIVSLQQMGNLRSRTIYEARLPEHFERPGPKNRSKLKTFIRNKYINKEYMKVGWTHPPPPPPQVDWEKEILEEMENRKRQKEGKSATIDPNVKSTAVLSKRTVNFHGF